ncbi:MAG: hypothetical protein JST51_01485 [Armatimonadetes bacterium]|nr:hypothetical protein [Armatimonadota bacterium]
MRPADLARRQQQRFQTMKLFQESAHRELVDRGAEDHIEFVQGGISEKMLASMGHPFAREGSAARGIVGDKKKFAGAGKLFSVSYTDRHGNWRKKKIAQVSAKGIVNPLPINVQTGELRRSFFKSGPTGQQHLVRMGFRSPHASEVLNPKGTKFMIYRGFYSKTLRAKSTSDLGIIARRHRARSQALIQALRKKQRQP